MFCLQFAISYFTFHWRWLPAVIYRGTHDSRSQIVKRNDDDNDNEKKICSGYTSRWIKCTVWWLSHSVGAIKTKVKNMLDDWAHSFARSLACLLAHSRSHPTFQPYSVRVAAKQRAKGEQILCFVRMRSICVGAGNSSNLSILDRFVFHEPNYFWLIIIITQSETKIAAIFFSVVRFLLFFLIRKHFACYGRLDMWLLADLFACRVPRKRREILPNR